MNPKEGFFYSVVSWLASYPTQSRQEILNEIAEMRRFSKELGEDWVGCALLDEGENEILDLYFKHLNAPQIFVVQNK